MKLLATVLTGVVFMSALGSDQQDVPVERNSQNSQIENSKKQEGAVFPIKKEDPIKLKISNPAGRSVDAIEDIYEITGSVASSDVMLEIVRNDSSEAESMSIDDNGEFKIQLDLQKGENTFKFIAKKEDEQKSKTIVITRKLSEEEQIAEIKTDAKTIPYKKLFRNIEEYKGEKIYYTGKVVQVIGDGKILSSMRVNITKGAYGFWDDTVLVANLDFGAKKILEDDIIRFWGVVLGEESYETVLGATVSLPSLSARVIELVE